MASDTISGRWVFLESSAGPPCSRPISQRGSEAVSVSRGPGPVFQPFSLPGRWEPGRMWRRHCWAVRDVEVEGTVPSLSPKRVDTETCHQERGRRPRNGNPQGLHSRTEREGVWSPRQDALACPGKGGGQGRPASAYPDPPGPILSPDGQAPSPEAPRLQRG